MIEEARHMRVHVARLHVFCSQDAHTRVCVLFPRAYTQPRRTRRLCRQHAVSLPHATLTRTDLEWCMCEGSRHEVAAGDDEVPRLQGPPLPQGQVSQGLDGGQRQHV